MQRYEFTVKATASEKNKLDEDVTATIGNDRFPETVEEAVEMYGEAIVFSKLRSQLTVDQQSVARRLLQQGKSPEQIEAYFLNVNDGIDGAEVKPWKPGESAVRKSAVDKAFDAASGLSEEQLLALLAKLQNGQEAETAEA